MELSTIKYLIIFQTKYLQFVKGLRVNPPMTKIYIAQNFWSYALNSNLTVLMRNWFPNLLQATFSDLWFIPFCKFIANFCWAFSRVTHNSFNALPCTSFVTSEIYHHLKLIFCYFCIIRKSTFLTWICCRSILRRCKKKRFMNKLSYKKCAITNKY